MSTREEDAALAENLKSHHAVMVDALDRLSGDLATAAASAADTGPAKQHLETWIEEVLVPHAEEEEATSYRAAAELPEARLLIRSMLEEHVLIRQTAAHVTSAVNPLAAGTYARSLFEIFNSHQRKENEMILPLLVKSDAVSLTAVIGHAHRHSR